MKERLLHNLGLKILSILVAALVWIMITMVDDPAKSKTFYAIPVEILNDDVLLSRGYQYSVESGETVDVRVKGKESLIESLTQADFTASADFNSLNSMYMTTINVVCLAEKANELQITPLTENMAILREEQDTRSYSLDIIAKGHVKEGFFCTAMDANATLIQATGSVSQIANIKNIAVTVELDNKAASFSEVCEVVAYDFDGDQIDSKKISFNLDRVDVNINICPTKEVELEAVMIGEPDAEYYCTGFEYAPRRVMIAAEESALKKISKIMIPCDISGVTSTMDVKVDLQTYLNELFNGECYAVDSTSIGMVANISPVEVRRIELSQEDIEIKNLGEQYSASVYAVWEMYLTIKGSAAEVEAAQISDFGLYLDLEGMGAGTYSRELMTDYSGNLKVELSSVMVSIAPAVTDYQSESGDESALTLTEIIDLDNPGVPAGSAE